MPSKVRWVVCVDPVQHCVHVNLVTKRVPGLPDEQEYLFAPYSAFTVRSVPRTCRSRRGPKDLFAVAARGRPRANGASLCEELRWKPLSQHILITMVAVFRGVGVGNLFYI